MDGKQIFGLRLKIGEQTNIVKCKMIFCTFCVFLCLYQLVISVFFAYTPIVCLIWRFDVLLVCLFECLFSALLVLFCKTVGMFVCSYFAFIVSLFVCLFLEKQMWVCFLIHQALSLQGQDFMGLFSTSGDTDKKLIFASSSSPSLCKKSENSVF